MKKLRIVILFILGGLWLDTSLSVVTAEEAVGTESVTPTSSGEREDITSQEAGGIELFDVTYPESATVDNLLTSTVELKLFTDIENRLNRSLDKLGYLVGDTLQIELDKGLFELFSPTPIDFPSNIGQKRRFSGTIKLTDFKILTGSSTKVDVVQNPISGNYIVTFTRLEHSLSSGGAIFEGKVSADIRYYDGNNWWQEDRGRYVTNNLPTQQIKKYIALTVADLPELTAELNVERRVLKVGESPTATDMLAYIDVLTSAGEVSASYTKEPNTSQVGITEAVVSLIDQYKQRLEMTIPLTIVDHIVATPIKQDHIFLGTRLQDLPYAQWLENVRLEKSNIPLKLGDGTEPNTYQVALKNPEQVIDRIGTQVVPLVVTAGEASEEFLVTVEGQVGTSLFVNNQLSQTIFALSLLPQGEGTYQLSASQGRASETGDIMTPIGLSIARLTESSVTLNDLKWDEEYAFSGSDSIETSYQKIRSSSVKTGDIIGITNHQMAQMTQPFEIYQAGALVDFEKPGRLGDGTVYFVVTASGFSPLQVNQLETTDFNVLELYQTEAEMTAQLDQYIQNDYLDKGVTVQGFDLFPNTQVPGEATGTLLASQTKESHVYHYLYPVAALVKDGALNITVPADFDFGTYTFGSGQRTLQRINSTNETVSVADNRLASEKSKWCLQAKIMNTADVLGKYVVYVNPQGETYYFKNGESVPVLQSTGVNEPGKIISSQTWDESEGILLKIPAQNELEVKSYQAEIEWTVTLGGEL